MYKITVSKMDSKKTISYISLIVVFLFSISCKKQRLYEDIDRLSGDGVIKIGTHNVSGAIGEVFSKYIYYTVPNGGRIHIFGTSGVSDEQMEYARDIFERYLTTEGAIYKRSAKDVVANSIANKKSALVFFDTETQYEENIFKVGLLGFNVQDLYATESLNSGNRDASYEEILHLVHNYGIAPTLFEYQDRLQRVHDNALKNGLWTPWVEQGLPKADFDDEYFAGLMDTYLGLYEGDLLGSFGGFKVRTKEELRVQDPDGYQLIVDLFGDIKPVVEIEKDNSEQ